LPVVFTIGGSNVIESCWKDPVYNCTVELELYTDKSEPMLAKNGEV
jgi:hypothetical protein